MNNKKRVSQVLAFFLYQTPFGCADTKKGYPKIACYKGGQGGSNPRPSEPQSDALTS
jgi:hypothetical protein